MTLLTIALAAWVGIIQAQPQRPSSSIAGTVVKLGSGEPLADMNVSLSLEVSDDSSESAPREQSPRKAASDSNGRFMFENVAPGEYRLIATSERDYVPAEYGQRSPTGQGIPFEIAAGQKLTGIQLAMSPTGSISGRVFDRDGEPLGSAHVVALRPVYKNGGRIVTIVQTVVTDDRGEYRLYWLAPGGYYIAAKADAEEFPLNPAQPDFAKAAIVHVSPPARFGGYEQATLPAIHKRKLNTGQVVEEMYLPVYYPNTVDIRAAVPVSVTGGSTVSGVNFAVGAGLITPHHIRGRVVDPSGQPVEGAMLTALPRTSDPYVVAPRARSAVDGTFDLSGAAPGSYQIFANLAGEARVMNGIASVGMADRDIQNVSIRMTPGFKLPGQFVIVRSGNSARPSFPRLGEFVRDPEVLRVPYDLTFFDPFVAPDGTFTVDGIPPGDFRVTVQGVPPDGYVKSMRMGNVDVLNGGLHVTGPPDAALEIVIGTNAGRIEGSVVNPRNEPLSNRTVVLVPDVPLRQRSDLYKVVSTNDAGVFRMQGITPGDYKLFAWENVETGAWQDPDFIQAYESAARRIRINESSNENPQLLVIP